MVFYANKWPCSFRWNLAYADAYADLLWEENIVRSLKSTAEVVHNIYIGTDVELSGWHDFFCLWLTWFDRTS